MGRPIKRQRGNGQVVTDIPSPSKYAVIRVGELCSRSPKKFYEQCNLLSVSLDRLIAPLDEGVFLSDCFRSCAVHIPALDPDSDRMKVVREQLFDLDPESILRETSSESVFVWLRNNEGGDDLIQSVEVGDPDTALALYKAGHATYCRAPPQVERNLVSSILNDTGFGCGQYDPSCESSLGRGEVEVFMSTQGHKTDWHFDFQENFTLQLSGIKRWTLQKSTVKHPLRGCTPHYRSPESVEPQLKAAHLADPAFDFQHPVNGINAIGEQQVVYLKPGDVLYHPAGMWHKIEVVEPGVSINISLMAANYAEVTCKALQHYLLKKDEWRESVTNNSTTNVVDKLKSLLEKLPGIIEDFAKDGGAEAMVPPAARQGASLAVASSADDDDDEDVLEDEDVMDFTEEPANDLPFRCTANEMKEQLRTHRLLRNPLASLLRESDLFKFYKKGDDEEDEMDDSLFVLNVNYAGNEGHESMIRKRIRASSVILDHLYAKSKVETSNRVDLPPLQHWVNSDSERVVLGCLVYYGYLLWAPN